MEYRSKCGIQLQSYTLANKMDFTTTNHASSLSYGMYLMNILSPSDKNVLMASSGQHYERQQIVRATSVNTREKLHQSNKVTR